MARRKATKEEFWETGLRWIEDAPKKKKVKAKKKEFDMEAASKKELEDFGREKGIELDRREKKSSLVEKLKDFLS